MKCRVHVEVLDSCSLVHFINMAVHPGGLWIYTERFTFKCLKPDGERTKQDLDQSVSLMECLI